MNIVDWYRDNIIDAEKQPMLLMFLAFLLAFGFIRFSVRMIRAQVSWWPGNVTPGGLHIHHVVFGLAMMLIAGVGSFSQIGGDSPWAEVFAIVFGIGAALVLDEFALILHLEDVYWAEKGRQSVDAVFLGAAIIGLLIIGASPFGIAEGGGPTNGWDLVLVVVINGLLVLLAYAKGKFWSGTIGLVVPLFATVGAIRLARPGSMWARRRYAPGSKKAIRAKQREERYYQRVLRFKIRTQDAIAGRHGEPVPAPRPPTEDVPAAPVEAESATTVAQHKDQPR
jgi:hypothetical protein